MTVDARQPWVEYNGNGIITQFDWDWGMHVNSSILCRIDDVKVTSFIVQGMSVVFDTAPADGSVVLVFRSTIIHNPENFRVAGRFSSEKTESAIDRDTYIAQELYPGGIGYEYVDPFGINDIVAVPHRYDVTIESQRGTDAVLQNWDWDDDPSAGVFAGEVNNADVNPAPADGSVTVHPKGYTWMEYGGGAVGICGTESSLDGGQLLNVGPIQSLFSQPHTISQGTAFAAGLAFSDTKVVSFTAAWMRELVPTGGAAYMHQIHDGVSTQFEIYMDASGYIKIIARNAATAIILEVTITNNGGSFADSTLYFMGGVIDLSDPAKREIFIDSVDVTDNASYVTWVTYTDDTIPLEASAGDERAYSYGIETRVGSASFGTTNSNGATAGIDSLGYCTFDDACTLITEAIWDSRGYVRDPQGKGTGWYLSQPQVFFGPTFWKNSGKTAPTFYGENDMEKTYDSILDAYIVDSDLMLQSEETLINKDIGGDT